MVKFFSRIDFNAPMVLGFAFISALALFFDTISGGQMNYYLFSVYRFPFDDFLGYLRLVTHVLGHANWSHYFGNMTLFLLLGPMLEEKYGSLDFLIIILTTAITAGLVTVIFFPNVRLLGASGVVFALIIASSLTSMKEGKIPLTFLLVVMIYIGQEVVSGLFVQDNVSQLGHIGGGIVGAIFGTIYGRNRLNH